MDGNMTRRTIALGAALALAVLGLGTGCHSIGQDHYRAGTHAEMVGARFKPTIEPIHNAEIAKGSAKSFVLFWILPLEWPTHFSNSATSEEPRGGFFARIFQHGDPLRDAAVYEACASTDADILLAPRFTEEYHSGPLWIFKQRKVWVEGIPARITGAQEIPIEKWPLLFGPNSGTQLIKTVN